MSLSFSDAAAKQIDEIVARYPDPQAALLPVLHVAQREFEYLSDEAMILVGKRLGVPPVKVRQVATFYTMYLHEPVGRFRLGVCTNIACYLTGGPDVLTHLKKKLGVGLKQTTDDGLFYLEEVECLASCNTAPCIQVDDAKDREWPIAYHENLDSIDKVDALIDTLRKKPEGAS